MHEAGKSLAFKASAQFEKKHSLKRKKHWFVPFRLPSTPSDGVGLHERTLQTPLGKKFLVLKGSGAPRDGLMDLDYNGRSRTPNTITPSVQWKPWYKLAERRLWGGTTRKTTMHEARIAENMHKKYRQMLANKDRVIKAAAKAGVIELPSLQPIAVFRPLQIPVEYRPDLEKGGERKRFSEKMTERERKAFDFAREQARKKQDRYSARKEAIIKIGNSGQLINAPAEVLREQVLFMYSARSPYRLLECARKVRGVRPAFIAEKGWQHTYPKDYDFKAMIREIEGMQNLFESHGFRLKAVKKTEQGSKTKKYSEFEAMEYSNGKWRKCSLQKASEKIMERFAAKLGLNLYIMHFGLNGTYSEITSVQGKKYVMSSLSEQNLSLAAEPLDLDTARIGIKDNSLRKRLQEEDIAMARSAIKKLAGILFEREETAKQAGKAIEIIEKMRSGRI